MSNTPRSILAVPAALFATALLIGTASANHIFRADARPISAAQEVPTNGSAGIGTVTASVDTAANLLRFDISYSGLTSTETGAHIHGPALPGANASVKFALPGTNPKTGVWNYSESDEADILAGKMYVNIHTINNGGGEIRGQINGLVENPVPAASNTGLILVALAFAVVGIFVVATRRRPSVA